MKTFIQYGSKQIDLVLEYSNRKSLGITVTPDSTVLIKAPLKSPIDKINKIIRNKAPWIIKQQSYFLSFYPKMPKKKYVSGETHLYLGRQYRLKVFIKNTESVKLKGKYIQVTTFNKSRAEQLLNEWYSINAKIKYQEIAKPHIDKFAKYGVTPSSIVLRKMLTRWGSCTVSRKIILNPELIKAPRACIEYVIIHELCHLKYHDHTQKFIALQTKEMPNWEKWKSKLEMILA